MKHNDTKKETELTNESGTVLRQESAKEKTELSDIEKQRTITDEVDFDRLAAELPPDWQSIPDLSGSESAPLAETILFQRTLMDPQLVLKPSDPAAPTEGIELYERSGPRETSELTKTIDGLSDALRVAVNRVHQIEARYCWT